MKVIIETAIFISICCSTVLTAMGGIIALQAKTEHDKRWYLGKTALLDKHTHMLNFSSILITFGTISGIITILLGFEPKNDIEKVTGAILGGLYLFLVTRLYAAKKSGRYVIAEMESTLATPYFYLMIGDPIHTRRACYTFHGTWILICVMNIALIAAILNLS